MNVQNRETAWAALHDSSTSAETLAEIAGAHPEFAPSIAQHPQAYPALREWAFAVKSTSVEPAAALVAEPQAPPVPHSHAAYGPAGYSPAPVGNNANAADAVMADANTARGAGLWRAVFVLVIVAPIVEVLALVFGGYSAYQWLILLGLAAPVLAAIAAGVSGPTVGRKVGGVALAIAAAGFGFFAGQLYYSYIVASVVGALAVTAMFLSWAVARPLRGAGYAALPVVIVLSILFQLGSSLIYWPIGDWQVAQTLSVSISVVGAIIVPLIGVLLARTWSRASERRAVTRPAAPLYGAVATVPGGDPSYLSLIHI